MPRISIELPLPPRECSPNWRGHTKARARAVARYRGDCLILYRQARIPALQTPITLQLEYFLARPKTFADRYMASSLYFPLDDDDAIGGFKAGRDALIDARIIPNDSRKHVRLAPVIWHTTAPDHQDRRCVVVHMEPAA